MIRRSFVPFIGLLLILVACAPGKRSSAGAAAGDPTIAAVAVPTAQPADKLRLVIIEKHPWDEFEQMILVLGLTDNSERTFRERMAQRREKLRPIEATLGKQVRDLKAAGKTEEAGRVQQEYFAERTKLRTELMSCLSPAQRLYWARWVIYRDVLDRRRPRPCPPARQAKAWELAKPLAEKLVAADYVATDPYLKNLGEDVKRLREQLGR